MSELEELKGLLNQGKSHAVIFLRSYGTVGNEFFPLRTRKVNLGTILSGNVTVSTRCEKKSGRS